MKEFPHRRFIPYWGARLEKTLPLRGKVKIPTFIFRSILSGICFSAPRIIMMASWKRTPLLTRSVRRRSIKLKVAVSRSLDKDHYPFTR